MATTAVHGSAGAGAFARGALADPRVATLRKRVRLVPHDDIKPWPRDRPARVEVTLTDGRGLSASVDSARGGPDDPFGEGELRAKIASLTADLYPAMAARLAELATSRRQWADDMAAMVGQPRVRREELSIRGQDIDILVIGAGGCGLAAAIAAHDAGASVAIVEKRDRPGGNSSLSTGSIPAAGTRFQRAAGIEDSPAQQVADLMRIAGDTDCPELVQRLAEQSRAGRWSGWSMPSAPGCRW